MSDDKQMQGVEAKHINSSPEETFRLRRRRLVASGLGASAMITTIASRSAWAGDIFAKCTKSGLQSANLSGQHTFAGCGKSAGYWKTQQQNWPKEVSYLTMFSSVFGQWQYKGSALFPNMTLGMVISKNGRKDNPGNIAMALVGAYVNSFAFPKDSPSGKGFVYYGYQIVQMFKTVAEAASLSGNDQGFASLQATLDTANNAFDGLTEWKP